MSHSSRLEPDQQAPGAPFLAPAETESDRRLLRWGGSAGLAGVVLMVGAVLVVAGLGLPDASDVETLTDFDDIELGRNLEHFFYLGAVMLFALHALVLYHALAKAHRPAALFGVAMAEFGLAMMAASSLLHLSTSPLSDLYDDPGASAAERQAVESAWYAAQSVFDTMLITGVLLVPIGIVLFGVAMRSASAFGSRLAMVTIGLGVLGIVGAAIAVIVPGSAFAAAAVLVIVVFNLVAGLRTLRLGRTTNAE